MTTLPALLLAAALGGTPQGEVLAFTTTWCGPCQKMSPIVSRLQRQGYAIRRIDGDRDKAMMRKFRISGFPTFVLVVGGKEVTRVVGATSESQLRSMAMQIPSEPSPSDPDLRLVDGTRRPAEKLQQDRAARAELAAADSKSRQRFALPLIDRSPSGQQVAQNEQPAKEDLTIRGNNSRREDSSHEMVNVAAEADPLAASTRIRVKDGGSINYGSGTIISSRPGLSVVLTCGHIFRKVEPSAAIEVDVISGNRSETFNGKVIDYDIESDVGLIAIPTEQPVPVVRVAPAGYQVAEGDRVQSVGCGGGELPSVQSHQVTAVNRYLGPDNIECTGIPIQGRSGGGLFSAKGNVVGVCNAADPQGRRGIYAGLKEVHRLLDRARLSALYQQPSTQPGNRMQLASNEAGRSDAALGDEDPTLPGSIALEDPRSETPFASLPERFEPADSPFDAEALSEEGSPFAEVAAAGGSMGQGELAPLNLNAPVRAPFQSRRDAADIATLQSAAETAGDAEVVCIIRSLENPQSASRVVIINRASAKFVSYLSDELSAQPQLTSGTTTESAIAAESGIRTPRTAASQGENRRPFESFSRKDTEPGSSWGHTAGNVRSGLPSSQPGGRGRLASMRSATGTEATPTSFQRYRRSSSSR